MDITRPLSVDPQFNPPNYIFRLFATLLENRIEFNAAANAAIDSSRRPISSRVLWRVRQSGSLEKIMLSVVVASAAQELRLQELRAPEVLARLEQNMEQDSGLRPALETEIFERLANDRRFSTLLLEEIERDKQWSDMSRKQFKSWTDWLKAFFEKLFDKKHPITRTAAALVVSGASVVASYNIALNILPRVVTDNLTVHIPIKPVAVETIIPVRLDLQGSPQSISIRVERPKTIDLQFAPRDPLKLNVIPTVLYSGASENRAANPGAKTPDCKPECPGLVSTAMPMEPLPVKVVGVAETCRRFCCTNGAVLEAARLAEREDCVRGRPHECCEPTAGQLSGDHDNYSGRKGDGLGTSTVARRASGSSILRIAGACKKSRQARIKRHLYTYSKTVLSASG